MNFLNGITEDKKEIGQIMSFWDLLPEKPLLCDIHKKEARIKAMQKRFRLFTEKNQLTSIQAQINSLINSKQDEIERAI